MQEIAKQEKVNIRESFFKYIKNIKAKSVRIASLLVLLLCIAVGAAYLPAWLVSPQRNIGILARAIDKPGKYSSPGAFLYIYNSSDYIVTLYSGEDSKYDPYLYITASRLGGIYAVDLIKGPGEENAEALRGDKALVFLSDHDIDLTEIEKAIARIQ